ncbi:MAG TPA: DUF2231 domain-containing protein [Methylomirabilota bacterium]|nr:DUF2231 domain-containing protein [Methylomirabilota bacterium]
MSTPASIGKHPIHPMQVVFPLGLLLAAVVFDVLTLLTGPTSGGRSPSTTSPPASSGACLRRCLA